jgi:drug/metabolite transporter (DMT)-like permease
MRTLRSWQLEFTALAAIWGSSFMFIKLIGERWPPLWVAFGRVSLGALTLLTIAATRRQWLRFDARLWRDVAIIAVLFNAAPFTLFAYGERHVSSIVAGLWNATTPLWTLVGVMSVLPGERLGAGRITGVLSLGVLGSGIAYLLNFDILTRAGATIASTVTYVVPLFATALGIIVLGESLSWNEPLGGAVLLAGVAITSGATRTRTTRPPGGTTGSLFRVFCSGLLPRRRGERENPTSVVRTETCSQDCGRRRSAA